MSEAQSNVTGPDFANGIAAKDVADGSMLLGHVGEEGVLLARRGEELFAIGATCSHYGGPLAEGLMVDDTVRCPWHHACFSFRTGEALRAPALSPVACWSVERQGAAAALNMLGAEQRFAEVPFFWSQHYDVPINYVGHAEKWDEIAIEGDIASRDCILRYKQRGRVLAVASIYRDRESLEAELAMERELV